VVTGDEDVDPTVEHIGTSDGDGTIELAVVLRERRRARRSGRVVPTDRDGPSAVPDGGHCRPPAFEDARPT
jgi:hypothetical protein